MRIEASAPAKLVLLGEYAVLEGAPALVAAVDRRVRASLEPRAGRAWRFESDLPGRPACEVEWNDEGLELRQLEPGDDEEWTVLPGTVLECVAEAAGVDVRRVPPCTLRLESRDLYVADGSAKLGLGSSAAALVALAAALRRHLHRSGLIAAEPAPEDALLEDLWIHAEVQHGRGSGVDVAAATFGGLLSYQVGEETLAVEPARLPAGVVFTALWTGTPASTAERLDALQAFEERAPEAYALHLGELERLASAGLAACREDRAGAFLDAVRAWTPALAALDAQAHVGIVSPDHARLEALCRGPDTAYKPSGAGGGDVGLLFARDADALRPMARTAEQAGYRCLSLHVHPEGVLVRSPKAPA